LKSITLSFKKQVPMSVAAARVVAPWALNVRVTLPRGSLLSDNLSSKMGYSLAPSAMQIAHRTQRFLIAFMLFGY
jgi:hypothetical protein